MGPPGLLDRDFGVGAVELEEIDVVGAQASQGAVDRLAHVLGVAVTGDLHRLDRAHLESALRGQHRVLAMPLERTSDELLVGVRTVGVGRIDQRHAKVESAADDRDRALVVSVLGVVGPRHAHAAKAYGPHLGAVGPERAGGKGEVHTSEGRPVRRGLPAVLRAEKGRGGVDAGSAACG